MLKYFFLVLNCFIFSITFSQNKSINLQIDSLTQVFKNDSLKTFRVKKIQHYFNLDNRNSYIKDKPANILGIQFGIIIKDKHIFGIGAYQIIRFIPKETILKLSKPLDNLRYLTLFYEYNIINKRFFELDIPFEMGFGSYLLSKANLPDKKFGFFPFGAGLEIVLKPLKWIGFSSMGGYRYVYEEQKNLSLDGFYYSLGLWIDLQEIIREVKFYGFQKKRYYKAIRKLNLK